jgi:hypothetical protein
LKDISTHKVLIIVGTFTAFYGLVEANWYGIYLIGIGISWVISSLILSLSKREITNEALASAFFFGFVGTAIWLIIDISRKQVTQESQLNASSHTKKQVSTFFDSNFFPLILFFLGIVLYRGHFLLEEGLTQVFSIILFAFPLASVLFFTYM